MEQTLAMTVITTVLVWFYKSFMTCIDEDILYQLLRQESVGLDSCV